MYFSIYTCHICFQEHRNSKTIVFFPLIHHHFASEEFLRFTHCTVWLLKRGLFASEKEWHIWCILGVNLFVKNIHKSLFSWTRSSRFLAQKSPYMPAGQRSVLSLLFRVTMKHSLLTSHLFFLKNYPLLVKNLSMTISEDAQIPLNDYQP